MNFVHMHQDTHAAQENGAWANGVSILTERTKSRFSRICSSVMSNLNRTKFTMEVPSTWERPQPKFKENAFNHSWDTSNQTFKKIFYVFSFCFLPFTHLIKIALTHNCILQCGWNLEHLFMVQRQFSLLNL